ncbi:MAG: hypothetical protein V4673_09375 [Pseudomonadota bacterium]
MRALEARANPPSPAAQAIAPFFKGGWKDAALFGPLEKWSWKGAALFDPFEKWSWKDDVLFDSFEKWSWKDAMLFTPFEKGGRHRAAMTGGFALRAPLASSAL